MSSDESETTDNAVDATAVDETTVDETTVDVGVVEGGADETVRPAQSVPTESATVSTPLSRLQIENMLSMVLEPGNSSPTRVMPGPLHKQVFHAVSGFAATPDMISFISSTQLTGILEVVTASERFHLEFATGDIAHAQSDAAPVGERLGDILVEQGAVTREALEAILAQEPRGRIGLTLWERQLVTHKQLVAALEEQIRQQFARMFSSPPLRFTFWSGPPMRAQKHLRMNATGLILDGARVTDERNKRG